MIVVDGKKWILTKEVNADKENECKEIYIENEKEILYIILS